MQRLHKYLQSQVFLGFVEFGLNAKSQRGKPQSKFEQEITESTEKKEPRISRISRMGDEANLIRAIRAIRGKKSFPPKSSLRLCVLAPLR